MPIKRERSPSPPLNTRRLVTSGSKLITNVPAECKRGVPNFEDARQTWAKSEVKKLRRIGLEHTKIYFRDDGLAIDWQSSAPVWSDTLLPPTADETSSTSNNASNAISRRQLSVGSAPSSTQRIDVSRNEAREPDAEVDQSNGVESVHLSQRFLENWERQAENLENDALGYLQRYAIAFDSDRTELAQAYADDAMFSCSVHDTNSADAQTDHDSELIADFVPRKAVRVAMKGKAHENIAIGQDAIISVLKQFGPHRLIPDSVAAPDVKYHTVYVTSLQAVMLTCDGNFVSENDERGTQRVSFSMAYLLRSSPPSGSGIESLWPLVAINHQLIVRIKQPRMTLSIS